MAGKKEKDMVRLTGGVSEKTPGTHGDDALPRSPDGVKEMGAYPRMSILNQGENLRMLGKILKGIRISSGMTRRELAKQAECRYDEIRMYENGERAMRVDRLFRILAALEFPILDCLTDSQVHETVMKIAVMNPENRRMVFSDAFAALEREEKALHFSEAAEEGV